MADETTDVDIQEELSICVRYVTKDEEGKYEAPRILWDLRLLF